MRPRSIPPDVCITAGSVRLGPRSTRYLTGGEERMKRGCLVSLAVVGGIVVVIVVAVVIAGVIGTSKAVHDANKGSKGGTQSVQAVGSHAASNDVQIMSCGNDPTLNEGAPVVRITNHSSDPSNYLITVVVDSTDGKTQVGTGNASADHLSAGQPTTATADMTQTIPSSAVCKVGEVLRYAS